jgi:hypothetical protein
VVYLVPISVGIVYSMFTADVCPMPRTPLVCGNFVRRLLYCSAMTLFCAHGHVLHMCVCACVRLCGCVVIVWGCEMSVTHPYGPWLSWWRVCECVCTCVRTHASVCVCVHLCACVCVYSHLVQTHDQYPKFANKFKKTRWDPRHVKIRERH